MLVTPAWLELEICSVAVNCACRSHELKDLSSFMAAFPWDEILI